MKLRTKKTALLHPLLLMTLLSCAESPVLPGGRKGTQAIPAPPAAHADPLSTLEEGLSKVQTERVTVSTALLRSLVRNQRIQQNQCKNISGQLEALKNVDLQESGETK